MFQSSNQFYYGVVESRADPLKLGRCKVRIVGIHTENSSLLPTKDLPWAMPLQPITSAGVSGIGVSPTGPVEGTWVVCFFRDGESYQEPIMIGTIGGIPEDKGQKLTDPYNGTSSGPYQGLSDLVDIEADLDGSSIDSIGSPDGMAGEDNGVSNPQNNVLIQTDRVGRRRQITKEEFQPGSIASDELEGKPNTITRDDIKGSVYGKYSIPSYLDNGTPTSPRAARSPVVDFVRQSPYHEEFKGLVPSSKQFDSKWQEVAAKDQVGFEREQREYAFSSRVVPAINDMRSDGIDLSDRGPAVQEMIFSTEMINNSSDQIARALKGKKLSEMTDAEIIQTVQEDKLKNIEKDYKTPAARDKAKSRIEREQTKLVKLAANDGILTKDEILSIKKKSKGVVSNSGVSKPITIPTNDKPGFQDPFDIYPRKKWIGEQDTSRLARNEKTDQTILRSKRQTLIKGVGTAGGGSWSEPTSPYNAIYPLNHVYQTESGHVQEFDDTPNAERIHVYHRSGSFTEYHPDGTVVFKSVKDSFQITVKDQNVYVGGNCNITVKGDANIYSQGMMNLESDGDMVIRSGSNLLLGAEGKVEVVANSDLYLGAGGNIHEGASNIMMNCSWFPSNISAGDHAVGSIQVQVYDDDESVPSIRSEDEASAINSALDEGSIPFDLPKPKKGSGGEMISTQTAPKADMASLEKTSADTKDVKCHGLDAVGSDPISTNYKLADLTTSPVLSKVSLQAQGGLTKCQIFDNLSALAKNVLEPIRRRYGTNFIITSALRQLGSNGKSQHPKGQAVDIQFPQLPPSEYVHRIEEICRILPDFDQAILEYHGRNPVIHISFNMEGNRREKKTTPDLRKYFSGFRDRSMGLVYGSSI